jgi:putative intracellular protease/amidase
MNTHLIPLSAAILFAVCAGSALISTQAYQANARASTTAPVAARIVDLPTVTVRPAAEDLAFYQANKIVDLAAVTVRPDASDLAFFLADRGARIVDMPVVTVRPSVEDMRTVAAGAAALAQQLASR